MASIIQIIVEAVDKASKELRKINEELDDMQAPKTASQIGDLGEGLAVLGTTAITVAAGVTALGLAMKEAFELGEQGAQIRQTEESFAMLLDVLGAAPDLLDDLQSASKGTISEMQLMTSTATLLAGTSGELGRELADATPQLLKIAKAANKLNPSLGDTAFLYESIATGVKRASPLILDNLGLTIKIGEANEKYAESLGKSVQELTAEEKQMALLNATLAAGDKLINQVGGSVESQTDTYAELRTNIEDAKNELLKHNDVVTAFVDATNRAYDVQERQNELLAQGVRPVEALRMAQQGLLTEQEQIALAADTMVAVFDGWQQGLDSVAEATVDATEANEGFITSNEDMLGLITNIGSENQRHADKLEDISAKMADNRAEAEQLYPWQRDELQKLDDKYADLEQAYADEQAAHKARTDQIIFDLLLTKLNVDGLTDAEFNAALAAGEMFGVFDAEAVQQARNMNQVVNEVISGNLEIDGMRDRLEKLPNKKTVDIIVRTSGFQTSGFGIPRDVAQRLQGQGFQSGTQGRVLTVPPGFPNDSFPIRLSSGEQFAVSKPGQSLGGNVTLVYAPQVSLATAEEAQNVLQPFIERGIREAQRNQLVGQ